MCRSIRLIDKVMNTRDLSFRLQLHTRELLHSCNNTHAILCDIARKMENTVVKISTG